MKKRLIISAIVFLCLALVVLVLSYHSSNILLIRTDDIDKTEEAVRSQFGSNAPNILICKTVLEREMLFVLYNDGISGVTGIKIYEPMFSTEWLFKEAYNDFSLSKKFNTFSSIESIDESKGMVVVYGDNSETGASSYEFSNSGKKYRNIITDTYILDIYFLNEMENINTSGLILFDEAGHEIA